MTKIDSQTKSPGRVLIVDDEEHIREILHATLKPVASVIYLASSAEDALELVSEHNLDIVVCDIRMPGMDGIEFLAKVKAEHPAIKFLMITAHGSMESAIQAMRCGASDFLTKPFENARVRDIVQAMLLESSSRSEPIITPVTETGIHGLLGSSESFKACRDKAMKAALSDSSVLVLGESGTGKEMLAKAIHKASKRCDQNFIAVNCGAIPENLIESELFGYEKGAFTGAMANKPGKIKLANDGTLFLDEIGEMPLLMQVKLLRVLQERVVDAVGSSQGEKVDFRLVAATNRDLEREVKEGRFRQDLYYRLNIIPILLPPLRERQEDVLLLAQYFLERFNDRYSCRFSLDSDTKFALSAYPWPGNIRELENVIERAVVLGQGNHLDISLPKPNLTPSRETQLPDLKSSRERAEKEEIIKALDMNRWNKTKTADALGISRRSLLYKIKDYAIE